MLARQLPLLRFKCMDVQEAAHSEELEHAVFEDDLCFLGVGESHDVAELVAVGFFSVVQVEDVAEEGLGF